MQEVLIHDTTLRDGEQMPGVVFSYDEKLELAKRSVEFGSSFIDIMPSVSSNERDLTKELAVRYGRHVSASCRALKEDINLAHEIGIRQIALFAPLSDIQLIHQRKISREENLRASLELLDYADDLGLVVDFAGSDSSRADFQYLKYFLEEISDKIRFFYIADTVGSLTPERAYNFVSELKAVHADLGVHMHNDLGLAAANTIAALRAGAKCFSGTFTGIGERAGNAPIEEVCLILKSLYNSELPVRYENLSELCNAVSLYSNVSLQSHKPVIGKNAFCHESGIHADGVIKHPSTYELIDPASVGRSRSFYFGKHSGRNILSHFLKDEPEDAIDEILQYIKSEAQVSKRIFSVDDVMKLSRKVDIEC